jgi:2-isopropylmalate synthase
VAASELALLAGADKVEGTLFGNGERTGNLDIVTLALNLFSQGIDPNLDFHDINGIVETYEHCTNMNVHARHPYAGELVYTAFSGSHQDAINKGMKIYQDEKPQYWDVPYLPIDPSDVGRTFESVIRINSQSGKGGVAYIMEREYGFFLPKEMHPEFGKIIQTLSEKTGEVVPPQMILDAFERTYFSTSNGLTMKSCGVHEQPALGFDADFCGSEVRATIVVAGAEREIVGTGNGPVDAFCQALKQELGLEFELVSYHEHALDQGSNSKAVAYIQIADKDKKRCFGAGIDTNISIASLKALLSALNRSAAMQGKLNANKP